MSRWFYLLYFGILGFIGLYLLKGNEAEASVLSEPRTREPLEGDYITDIMFDPLAELETITEETTAPPSLLDSAENFLMGGLNRLVGTFDTLYQKWGQARGIDWKLIKAVALQESNENPNAVGDGGQAIGLMQVWSYHWGPYTREQMFDPDHNIEQGSAFLAYLVNKYGMYNGLEAYNEGEGAMVAGKPYSTEYASSVMSKWSALV